MEWRASRPSPVSARNNIKLNEPNLQCIGWFSLKNKKYDKVHCQQIHSSCLWHLNNVWHMHLQTDSFFLISKNSLILMSIYKWHFYIINKSQILSSSMRSVKFSLLMINRFLYFLETGLFSLIDRGTASDVHKAGYFLLN